MSEESNSSQETAPKEAPKSEETVEQAQEDFTSQLAKLREKYKDDKEIAKAYFELEKKLGHQGNELGEVRKQLDELGKPAKETPKEEVSKEEQSEEGTPQWVKDKLKKQLEVLPTEDRAVVLKELTPERVKELERDIQEKYKDQDKIPDYLKELVPEAGKETPTKQDESPLWLEIRKHLGLIKDQVNEHPPGAGSSPSGYTQKDQTTNQRHSNGGLDHLMPAK